MNDIKDQPDTADTKAEAKADARERQSDPNDLKDQAFPKVARVAEKTVQAIASGDIAFAPKATRKRRKAKKKAEPAAITHRHTKVLPEVWAKVVEIRDSEENPYSKVEIISDHEVIIR